MRRGAGMLTREEALFDLLRYALKKKGISSNWFVLFNQEFDRLPAGMGESGLGLVKKGDQWLTYTFDRANRSDFSLHDKLTDALEFAYWQLTRPPSMFEYLTEWKAETGQEIPFPS